MDMGSADNITLIGMPGSGKSTLGRALADRLGYEFVDGDEIIRSMGGALQHIIDSHGEKRFLEIEEAALLSLGGKGKVFSPGGSCVLSSAAMNHLRSISVVLFLDVAYANLVKRLSLDGVELRGIVGLKELGLQEVYKKRRPVYLKYAHVVVRLEDRPIRENVELLLARILP